MKLDYEAIRHILMRIEENEKDKTTISDLKSSDFDDRVINYHLKLLLDVGYIETKEIKCIGAKSSEFIVKRMTMQGHQYLDSIRDDNVWKKTKEVISKTTSSVTLDIIKSVAVKVIGNLLGI